MTKPSSGSTGVARRRFLKSVPAAVAAGLAAPAAAREAQDQPRIDTNTLECADDIFGIDFSAAEHEQMPGGVNRSLESFEQLRRTDIP
ncbi:MAG: hypothetical protein ACRD15_10110, partial [Vicinamibacterales bacterium]